MTFFDRAAWGARPPRSIVWVRPQDKTHTFLHHSTGSTLGNPDRIQWVQNIQAYHMDTNGWADIAYSFLVDDEGNVYEGRGWDKAGAHTKGFNTVGHGICYLGSGDMSDGPESPAAHTAIRSLFDEADVRAGRPLTRKSHRDVYATACPGDDLDAWLKAGMPADGFEQAPAPAPQPELSGPPTDGFNPNTHPGTAPAPQEPVPPFPGIMQKGSRGIGVAYLQDKFMHRGWQVTVDGIFGKETDTIVRKFQSEKGLDVDGIVGPKTWTCLWTCAVT